MTDGRREQLARLGPAVGSCLTLTIVLLASLAPGTAAAASDGLGGRDQTAPAVRRSAGFDPVLIGGVVIASPAIVQVPVCTAPTPLVSRGDYATDGQHTARPGPDPRLAPVRGP